MHLLCVLSLSALQTPCYQLAAYARQDSTFPQLPVSHWEWHNKVGVLLSHKHPRGDVLGTGGEVVVVFSRRPQQWTRTHHAACASRSLHFQASLCSLARSGTEKSLCFPPTEAGLVYYPC